MRLQGRVTPVQVFPLLIQVLWQSTANNSSADTGGGPSHSMVSMLLLYNILHCQFSPGLRALTNATAPLANVPSCRESFPNRYKLLRKEKL